MNTEWTELPTMTDVARAKVEGWEIEVRGTAGGWCVWRTRMLNKPSLQGVRNDL